jgi:hypothetical protein
VQPAAIIACFTLTELVPEPEPEPEPPPLVATRTITKAAIATAPVAIHGQYGRRPARLELRAGLLSRRFGACTLGGRGVFAFFGTPTGYGVVLIDLAAGSVDDYTSTARRASSSYGFRA